MAVPFPELTQFKTREEQDQEIRVSERPSVYRQLTREKRALAPILDRKSDETDVDHDADHVKGYIPYDGGLNELEKQATIGGKTIVTYPDGGLQAWLVVLGGFLMVFSGFGMIGSYGAFNTYYHNHNLSAYPLSVTAWIGSLQAALVFTLAIIGGSMFDKYGPRPLMIFGTITSVAGYLALSWCTQLWHFFLVQSVLISTGMGAMFVCGVGGVADWFDERKGLATGIVVGGSSLGSIVWPLMIANLPQRVGFGWTVRIIALIQLVALSSATLLIRTRLPRQQGKPLFMPKTFLTHPAYTCMAASCFFFSMGFFFFLVYCGQYALEIGAGDAAPYVLIACNAASLLGRISSGVIADRLGYFNILILELVVTFIIIFAWMAIKSVPALFVAAVFYGLVTGGNIALQGPCVIAVTKDLGCAGTLIGQLYGCQSLALLLGPPISGYILGNNPAKQMGNYKYAIIMNGLLMMLATGFAMGARYFQTRKIIVVV
ncbi:hypothetical protein FFLO_01343 [Filobasidium floriforme]|uniref:Major facilitator superfamily (MFS) profile domain-containing protein n=1 Tax=Filobasidium floriforme TaxID=5210 RepID=A0A8K0JR94_9TREE|nr:hypothetical protein FFLO_01343 [Filobasidium floriforme]